MYKFDRYGVDRAQQDVVWDGGVTIRL